MEEDNKLIANAACVCVRVCVIMSVYAMCEQDGQMCECVSP